MGEATVGDILNQSLRGQSNGLLCQCCARTADAKYCKSAIRHFLTSGITVLLALKPARPQYQENPVLEWPVLSTIANWWQGFLEGQN